jgi:cellulose biosynthesis protein BcsQ
MFNNKGGVGKTTLTCNIASYLSKSKKMRVLVIDCDPQCNSTQLILGKDYIEEFYLAREMGEVDDFPYTTISDIVSPIEEGEPEISNDIRPFSSSDNRFSIDLIPGDPKFSAMEDRFGAAWQDLLKSDIGGFRKSQWAKILLSKLKSRYDIIFFDLGPSLGAINRSILISCDLFATPMTSDIFSIIGIKNITEWINKWSKSYVRAFENLEEDHPESIVRYDITKNLPILNGYIGYTLQQYIAKTSAGEKRPTKAYEDIIKDVPKAIDSILESFTAPNLTKQKLKLGDIPHMYSLVPLAQSKSAPVFDLKSSDGLVGYHFKQRDSYKEIIGKVANSIVRNAQANK